MDDTIGLLRHNITITGHKVGRTIPVVVYLSLVGTDASAPCRYGAPQAMSFKLRINQDTVYLTLPIIYTIKAHFLVVITDCLCTYFYR